MGKRPIVCTGQIIKNLCLGPITPQVTKGCTHRRKENASESGMGRKSSPKIGPMYPPPPSTIGWMVKVCPNVKRSPGKGSGNKFPLS